MNRRTTCVKLCIDCRFYGNNAPGIEEGSKEFLRLHMSGATNFCLHPSTIGEIDLVDGNPRRYSPNALAYSQRQYSHWYAVLAGRCGSRARFFEPLEAK